MGFYIGLGGNHADFSWLHPKRLQKLLHGCGEKFTSVPRGFPKGFVDVLDELGNNPQTSASEMLAVGIDADCIEAVERAEAHLLDYA